MKKEPKKQIFVSAKSIYDIDINFYKKFNIKFLLLDLDNTLDSYKTKVPSEKTIELFKKLKENGITPIIISNNSGPRVSKYAECAGVMYLGKARKPFGKRLIKFLNEKNIDKNFCVFIGDQVITDMGVANRTNIKGILTDKIVNEDQWMTRFNRPFDRILKRRLLKKQRLINWRTVYDKD